MIVASQRAGGSSNGIRKCFRSTIRVAPAIRRPTALTRTLLAQHRPSVLVPFTWDNPSYRVKDTGFEVALRELAGRLNKETLTLSPSDARLRNDRGRRRPDTEQTVRVSGAPGENPSWFIQFSDPFLTVVPQPDGHSFSVATIRVAARRGHDRYGDCLVERTRPTAARR